VIEADLNNYSFYDVDSDSSTLNLYKCQTYPDEGKFYLKWEI